MNIIECIVPWQAHKMRSLTCKAEVKSSHNRENAMVLSFIEIIKKRTSIAAGRRWRPTASRVAAFVVGSGGWRVIVAPSAVRGRWGESTWWWRHRSAPTTSAIGSRWAVVGVWWHRWSHWRRTVTIVRRGHFVHTIIVRVIVTALTTRRSILQKNNDTWRSVHTNSWVKVTTLKKIIGNFP